MTYDKVVNKWIIWFTKTRLDIFCKAYVTGYFIDLYEKTAFECGAIAVYHTEAGVIAIFKDMPKDSST